MNTASRLNYNTGQDLVIETSDRLRIARIRAGLEQDEMAEVLGVSTSTVSNWEHGRTKPKLAFIAAWAQITGYNLASLNPPKLAETPKALNGNAHQVGEESVSQLPCLGSNQEPPGWPVEHTSEPLKRRNVNTCLSRRNVSWPPTLFP
jgi:transcriptional regulator with XRE-family HTH domain